jgi:hypothetical protein
MYLSSINCLKSTSTNYLSNCDLINKYNLTNINKIPKLSEVAIEISSSDILNSSEIAGKNELDSELQIKSYFILYLIQALIPFISFNNSKKVKEDGLNYSLKIVLSAEDEIYSFLINFFVENWNKLLAEDFSFWSKSDNNLLNTTLHQKKIIIQRKIPAEAFFEIDSFLSKGSFGIIAKNLNLKIKFIFQNNNVKEQNTPINLIKNTPLFWISG